jgi:hypothetical protein
MLADVSDEIAASMMSAIAAMMEEASASETSVNFYQTIRLCYPIDSRLQRLFQLAALTSLSS